ncbi:MAG TPA: C40 family peptidase [Nocardioidaceae bacterium]|nr:C40 family peptidase [Nocardioidaceae bacterium]
MTVAAGGASVLCLTLLPGAAADPDDPSREDVRKARERVTVTADRVDAIKAQLANADQWLETLSVEAGKAVEAYNGARYQLRQARVATRKATRRADATNAHVRRYSDALSDAVVTNYENSGSLTSLSIVLRDPDPKALMERLYAYETVTGAIQVDLDGYEAASIVADRAQDRAEAALKEQDEATEAAQDAKESAEAAMAKAEAAVAEIADEKRALVRKLARAQGVSVKLAQQRQQALAEQAAEEAAEQAEQQAEQQDPAPQDNDPAPGGDPAPSGGVEAAVDFAKAQLGEPYVYGAAGPDSWDCSGLTMEAWAAGGESLSHWSVAQYNETTPISFSDLRRGDLLFWGDSDDPDSIYHVAMYLGNGQMIHAPQPGENVEIVSLYYWILPNLYGRV